MPTTWISCSRRDSRALSTSTPILPPNHFGHGYRFRRRPLNHAGFRLALALAAGLALGVTDEAEGRLARSYAVKAAFKREHPCPATGARRGPCPGFEIDHVVPLKCGGPDVLGNLQWLSVADHAAKTRRELPLCRNR